ncbi:DNA polymerase III subunit gamma/tau [Flavobacterium sp.]|uniref:DNA polymerase III subunit gamma/tau n=1 Tax=Flavobacterium sp. TaxID=239 RepID=UPI003BC393BE
MTSPEVKVESPVSVTETITISDNSLPESLNLKPETSSIKSETTSISALSMSSIRAKKELLESQKGIIKEVTQFPTEVFTETEMLDFWFKYAQRLNDKGLMIMASLLRISDPKLDGFKIIYELPNEGSKIDFEKEKNELLGYLRGHLHNHELSIDVVVNENVKSKVAFTAQDKYNRLNEINPHLEELKRLFDLDL